MLTPERFFGGSQGRATGVGLQLNAYSPRLQVIVATVAALHIRLPPAFELPVHPGATIFYFVNNGGTHAFGVYTFEDALVRSCPADKALHVGLSNTGTWYAWQTDVG